MDRTTSRADRCSTGSPVPKGDRMALLKEIAAFTREHADIIARYHLHTMDDLKRIEEECWRLHDEACSRGACGSAGELVELEYLIGRAKEMKAKRMEGERGPG
ncbi:hypothetical protein [Methanoculleus sp.]|uniref:hypothetical protein n=2 Tax=unclassified Methanoculleus TaxID=2619537 RepID=UPI0025D32F3C|nr:hypothetical protein [Methanoculleus sp.]MCK9318888.1 hypothetical protein [Methanoculleus sp.]MDD2254996.1 hypothetical protein [Methanoculleus sp.]MDD2788312.1 hypothetical protein [Methanoculleus sp.]MDD3217191.1 hypothetical protein [Methanoculleus sp.]MDD4315279.1 hypothetical protein [Methanoculleus sp.]